MTMQVTFSIAIAAHNPDRRTLGRLLKAIRRLDGIADVESILLVDNNSKPRLDEDAEVVAFIESLPRARYVFEAKPGLTAARCRAIRESASDVLVYFDDDNEPAANYLTVLDEYFCRYPNVGVWGPGTVKVEFLDETPEEIRRRPELFQDAIRAFGFACIDGYYGQVTPLGTGFAVRRNVLVRYDSLVTDGTLCLTDRQGRSLSSGGDVQIVWEATKMGMASGVIPELVCGHLINGAKANIDYLGRLVYGCAASYAPAISESFPELAKIVFDPPAYGDVLKVVMKQQLKKRLKPHRRLEATLIQARLLGQAVSQATVCNKPTADRFLRLARWLGFC
jgi:glycosyltransferase involved in cell wall biosynthesis